VSGYIVTSVQEAVATVKKLACLDRSVVRQAFERRFTVGRMAEHYLAIYNQLLNGGRDSCCRPPTIPM
jgi:hypothetical protein